MKDIERKVAMRCPVCGNDQFESLDVEHDDLLNAPGTAKLRCSDCSAVYTKDELIAENGEAIDIAVDEIAAEAVKDFEKELKKAMKKWKF